MRFSLVFLALLSVFSIFVAALPGHVPVPRAPPKAVPARRLVTSEGAPKDHHLLPKGRAPRLAAKGTARSRGGGPSKAAPKQGATCARRGLTNRARDLEFEYFDRRDGEELKYDIGEKTTGGSYGDIHGVIGHPNLLAKRINVKPGVGKQTTPEAFEDEAKNLKKVGQFEEFGYKTDGSCNKVYYIIMKKVSGIPLPKTKAYAATKGDVAKRKALVDHVIALVADKVLDYVKKTGVLHGDLNGSNVMCVENEHGQIAAVDLVDWALVAHVDRNKLTHAEALQEAKIGLAKMYWAR